MNKERKKQIINFCIQMARDEFDEKLSDTEKMDKMNSALNALRPNPVEFAMMIDLVDKFVDKIKKGEI